MLSSNILQGKSQISKFDDNKEVDVCLYLSIVCLSLLLCLFFFEDSMHFSSHIPQYIISDEIFCTVQVVMWIISDETPSIIKNLSIWECFDTYDPHNYLHKIISMEAMHCGKCMLSSLVFR